MATSKSVFPGEVTERKEGSITRFTDHFRILVRLWTAGVLFAASIGFGLARGGISLLPSLLAALAALSLSPLMVFLYNRQRRLGKTDEVLRGVHDKTFTYTLIMLIASGLWMGVAYGKLHRLLALGSATQEGAWLQLGAPVVFFGAMGLQILNRPQTTGGREEISRTAGWLLIGIAIAMALLSGLLAITKLAGANG